RRCRNGWAPPTGRAGSRRSRSGRDTMLGRLRIRGRLLALVTVPLVLVLGLATAIAVDRAARYARASATVGSARLVQDLGRLLAELQEERLFAVGYKAGVIDRAELADQGTRVVDLTRLARDTAVGRPDLAAAVEGVASLDSYRTLLLRG